MSVVYVLKKGLHLLKLVVDLLRSPFDVVILFTPDFFVGRYIMLLNVFLTDRGL